MERNPHLKFQNNMAKGYSKKELKKIGESLGMTHSPMEGTKTICFVGQSGKRYIFFSKGSKLAEPSTMEDFAEALMMEGQFRLQGEICDLLRTKVARIKSKIQNGKAIEKK